LIFDISVRVCPSYRAGVIIHNPFLPPQAWVRRNPSVQLGKEVAANTNIYKLKERLYLLLVLCHVQRKHVFVGVQADRRVGSRARPDDDGVVLLVLVKVVDNGRKAAEEGLDAFEVRFPGGSVLDGSATRD